MTSSRRCRTRLAGCDTVTGGNLPILARRGGFIEAAMSSARREQVIRYLAILFAVLLALLAVTRLVVGTP